MPPSETTRLLADLVALPSVNPMGRPLQGPEVYEHRVTAYEHWARFCQGIALRRRGDPHKGSDMMCAAMDAAQKMSADFLRPLHLGHRAAALTDIAQPETGLGLLDEAIRSAEKTEERFFLAELHRLRGEAWLSVGSERDGALDLERALMIARSQGARLWELRASTSLACLWRDRDRFGEARALLEPIYGWFTEGLERPDLRRARALLHSLH